MDFIKSVRFTERLTELYIECNVEILIVSFSVFKIYVCIIIVSKFTIIDELEQWFFGSYVSVVNEGINFSLSVAFVCKWF